MNETEEAYRDVISDLQWLLQDNSLSKGKRDNIRTLALKLAGEAEGKIPSWRLREEAEADERPRSVLRSLNRL
jgi:hypothetical protein